MCTFFDFASLCQKRCYFEKTMRNFLNPLPMFYFGVLFINSKYFENHQKSTFSILPENSEFSCQIHHFGINFKYFRTSTTKCLKTRSNWNQNMVNSNFRTSTTKCLKLLKNVMSIPLDLTYCTFSSHLSPLKSSILPQMT